MVGGSGMIPTADMIEAIADVIYRVEAPRAGNDIKLFDQLGRWEQVKYRTMAENAVSKWESLRPVDAGAT
jgi:hypothetical protein